MSAVNDEALGGRLPLYSRAELDADQQDLFDHLTQRWVTWADGAHFESQTDDGRLIGPFNALLLSPVIARGFLDFQTVENRETSLTSRMHEVIILSVGAVWKADYELYAHSAVARRAGLAEETVEALVAGRPPEGLSEEEATAARFAHELTAEHRVSEDVYRDAERALGRRSIADMILLIGAYHAVCALLCGFTVPAPD